MRRFLIAVLTLVAGLLAASSAAAHSELVAAEPQPGQTVGEVERIRLIFAGDFVAEEGVEVTLERRSDGELVELGEPETPTAASIEVDVVGELLGPGDYVVRYTTVAADEGLRQPGGFAFTYDPSVGGGGGGGGSDPIAVGAVLVGTVALLALVVIVARGRRASTGPDTA